MNTMSLTYACLNVSSSSSKKEASFPFRSGAQIGCVPRSRTEGLRKILRLSKGVLLTPLGRGHFNTNETNETLDRRIVSYLILV